MYVHVFLYMHEYTCRHDRTEPTLGSVGSNCLRVGGWLPMQYRPSVTADPLSDRPDGWAGITKPTVNAKRRVRVGNLVKHVSVQDNISLDAILTQSIQTAIQIHWKV